ncbi:MipA/OmpV family protein [Oricola thermophila]|uniref:MipA/OmpV family protein n=1 Tax=Oricola thermophila TaxID=2742145 RepID=A0A6N1VLY1_9HYPH|nr:MipA/OmpV family protein [Oricola thermophila]QKV19957.1 MipA/OmpV family protein [Oricola thermophila]
MFTPCRRAGQPATTLLAAFLLAGVAPSMAGDMPPGIEFELGGGGAVAPRYESSSEYLVSPFPTFRLKRLTFSNGFQIGGGDGMGLSPYPSFNFRGARKAADTPALAGLADVDAAVELGLGLSYATPGFRVFGEVRRGVTGHDGMVGEIGADLVARPGDRLTLAAGPRASFADAEYMDTYFGVTAAEAIASGMPQFDARSGFKSYGLAASARFDLSENWALEGSARYDRLTGDAANSPVTGAGSRNQFGFRLGLTRSFRIDF